MSNGVLQPEDLCVECFRENVQNLGFPAPSTAAQAYNLYRGLVALSETVRTVFQEQRKAQQTLDRLQQQIEAMQYSLNALLQKR